MDPRFTAQLAATKECANAARLLNLQTHQLARVLVDTGVATAERRIVRRTAAELIRKRASVIGFGEAVSAELNEIATQLEQP
jgi:hypothetical protein